MLILTRRPDETITIGDNIEIEICGIRGNQARIGIRAPRGMEVHRSEIYERIKAGQSLGVPVAEAVSVEEAPRHGH